MLRVAALLPAKRLAPRGLPRLPRSTPKLPTLVSRANTGLSSQSESPTSPLGDLFGGAPFKFALYSRVNSMRADIKVPEGPSAATNGQQATVPARGSAAAAWSPMNRLLNSMRAEQSGGSGHRAKPAVGVGNAADEGSVGFDKGVGARGLRAPGRRLNTVPAQSVGTGQAASGGAGGAAPGPSNLGR